MIGYTSSSGNGKTNNNVKSKTKYCNFNKIRNTPTATEKALIYLVK